MPQDSSLVITSHESLGGSHFLLGLAVPESATFPNWSPGQFAMLSIDGGPEVTDPLLRRPFSIFNLWEDDPTKLQVFYKVLGRGTGILSRTPAGATLRCLAPLGNGFSPGRPPGSRLCLVAGGIGSASLHPLALHELRAGSEPLMLYGCRTESDLAGIRLTRDAGIACRVATDDGSAGVRGTASDLLERFLSGQTPGEREAWIVCACGPTPMMQATAEVAHRYGVTCHVSLESTMACGFGVCVGCVVGTRGRDAGVDYRRICIDGPVFDAAQVIW